MASKYLSGLSDDQRDKLRKDLHEAQDGKCYICQKEISMELQGVDIDHIIPLNSKLKGSDSPQNFALAHDFCNRSKQDSDLRVARMLHRLIEIQNDCMKEKGRSASLEEVLEAYGGSKYDFKYKVEGEDFTYCYSEIGENDIKRTPFYEDRISKEKYCFIDVPIEYLFHDKLINPRGINNSISKLVKEFHKGNPQLHTSLARIEDGKIKIFDGQHKAVAQILLGAKRLVLRLFEDPNVERLTETNTNAGSTLRQIAFDKSVMRQLNSTLYMEKVRQYQKDHSLKEDDYSFSEQNLVDHFKGENRNIKKYIIESIKHSITLNQQNKLSEYIDFDGKAKEKPLSHSAFDKTILSYFIDSKNILKTPIEPQGGIANVRENEINQMVKLLNIVADQIYINKFDMDVGVARIEKKLIDKKDNDITDEHLTAFRMSKEEVLYAWIPYIENIAQQFFLNNGKSIDASNIFQEKFPDQLWKNIENFIYNFKHLPLWKNRTLASTIFAGKQNKDFWKEVFSKGMTPDGVKVLAEPVNFTMMIQSSLDEAS
jgi:hypothetical protein